MNYNFFVYIITNIHKSVLYTGVTNDLQRRLFQHNDNSKNYKTSFAGKYNCVYLLYWERFQFIEHAIEREKHIKGWTRIKKIELIKTINPELKFLNSELE